MTIRDIFFDDTIALLKRIRYGSDVLVLLPRRDIEPNGTLHSHSKDYDVCVQGKLIHASPEPQWSQDAWACRPPLKSLDADLELGAWNCETQLRVHAAASGIRMLNVFNYVNAIHVHWTRTVSEVRQSYPYESADVPPTRSLTGWINSPNSNGTEA